LTACWTCFNAEMEITTTKRRFLIVIAALGMCVPMLLWHREHSKSENRRIELAIVHELVNSSKYPMAILDPNARVTLWNPAMEDMTGRTSQEMLGQTLEAIMRPDDYHAHGRGYAEEMLKPRIGERFTLDCEIVRKDGEVIPVTVIRRVVQPDGWPPFSVAHIEDRRTVTKLGDEKPEL
jgi:PAS domain S-box-containing protein